MALGEQDLLADEAVRTSKGANAVISVDEAGLSRFAFDHLMGTVGMAGHEAIGGRLHLTNYRLVFNAHAANRLRGRISILLPTIQDVRNTSRGVKRQIEVVTGTQRFTFVLWGVPAFIAAVDSARGLLGDDDVRQLTAAATAQSSKLGLGLKVARGIETLNARVSALTHADATPVLTGPDLDRRNQLETASALNLAEFLADGRNADHA